MTTVIIPILAAMSLGTTFDLVKYKKGSAEVFDSKTIEEENLQIIDRSFTRSQYKLVETSTQAREFLDVNGALSLRIKKGDLTIDGTGTYLRDTANRQKFVELLVRVQHETITKTIPSHLKPRLDWMGSKKPHEIGTHYVRSIVYGGELIASLKLKANNREEREIIKAAISANLQLTGTFDLNANGSFDQLRKDLAGMYNEEINVVATQPPSSPPRTVEQLMRIVENYPKEVTSMHDGKGTKLKAELYPLSALKADYPNYLPNSAINSLLDDVETKFDDIRTVVHDFYEWNNERDDSTKEQDDQIKDMLKTLQNAKAAFHKAISDMDMSINGTADQFKEALEAYGTGVNNVPNRFQRWFWKLKHEITKEPIVWEKPNGSGAVYINWGMSTCPASSGQNVKVLYSGQMGGPLKNAWGGGHDYECMKSADPVLSQPLTMQPRPALLDSVEFRTISEPDKAGIIPCAACFIKQTIGVKQFYGHVNCPKNWKKEYSGLLMASDSNSKVDGDFVCLNKEIFSNVVLNEDGKAFSKLNPVWMNCKDCNGERIVPCVICSYENKIEFF